MKRLAFYVLVSCLSFFSVRAAAQNVIATIAGYGGTGFSGDGGPATSALLNSPQGVAVDPTGNVFIADAFNNRVRKISPSGIITTVAGNGPVCMYYYCGGFSGDGGPATSASLNGPSVLALDGAGNLFIADGGNNRIRKVSTNGIITTVAGGGNSNPGDGGPATAAAISPTGIAADGSGNLFIADSGHARIRKVVPSGVISTVAGNGKFDFSGDGGQATLASLSSVNGVAIDASGNLFIGDNGNSRIRKVSSSGIITTVAGNGNYKFSGDGGPATSASFSYLNGVAVDDSGDIFILDDNRLRMVSAGGIIATVAGGGNSGFSGDLGSATAATFNYPAAFAAGASGNLFIADTYNNRLREVSSSVPPLAATLFVDPASLNNFYVPQGSTLSQILRIGGVPGIKWQATATTSTGGAWLSVSPSTGQAPSSLTALLNAGSLTPGNYQGSITIRAPGAIPPSLTIDVMVQVFFVPTEAYQISNAASGYVSGQNGVGIAQGSLFVVQGDYLGPAILQQPGSFPIPTTLAGTSIQIMMSGGTYNPPMISTSYSQVSAILPSIVPVGDGMLVVTYNGTAADPIPIHVVKSAFGIFTIGGSGGGPGIVQDVNNVQLTFAQPAHPGDTVSFPGTGLGPVNGDETAAPLTGNLFMPEVFVGNQAAAVQYAGRSSCCGGQDQIVFQIPSNVQGCFVPLAVRMNGVVSNFVSVPVAGAGEACSDPVGFSPDQLSKVTTDTGLRFGGIAIGSVPVLQNAGFSFVQTMAERMSAMLGTTVTVQELKTILNASRRRRGRAWKAVMQKYTPILKAKHIDPATIVGMASMMNYQGVAAAFQQGMSPLGFSWQAAAVLPPPGTCTTGTESSFGAATNVATAQGDDAGSQLILTGPAGAQTLNQGSSGIYQLSLGPDSPYYGLPEGPYTVSSNGGNDVGAFSATIQIGPALTWTNKDSVAFVDRSAPLTITWSGGPPIGYVVVTGGGKSDDGVATGFTCVADVRDQSLTVPDYVLSAIPHSSHGFMAMISHPLQNLFSAPGIDVGYFADVRNDSKPIGFQ